MGQVDIKRQDGISITTLKWFINNHIKYKWSKYTPKINKYPNKRAEYQTGFLKKARQNYMLLTRSAF